MNRHEEILKRGQTVYATYARNQGYTYCNRRFADASSTLPPVYILVESRFTTGHDDTAIFVELIDEKENIILSWKFEGPEPKRFENPNYYDNDCLVYYLQETFHLPTVGYSAPK